MRILFVIESLTVGGKERRLSQLMQGIRSNPDFEFSLVTMSTDMHYKEVLNLNIDIHYILRKTKKDITVFYRLYKLCRKYKPDIIHCWDAMTAIYLVPACKLLNITLVNGMVVDSPVQQNIFNKYWLRAQLTFPFSDLIIGNSNAGLRAYRAPSKKSVCIVNGMDLTRFQNLKDPANVLSEILGVPTPGVFIAGMVASFEERKDYDTLISAAVAIVQRRDDIRFILVGDGPNFERNRSSVPENMLNRIIFPGRRSDVESIINIFDAGILITNSRVHGEGISNSIIEYMALGKPVIATRGGGTDEVVLDDVNGYLVDPENPIQLAERIESLADNKQLAGKLGKEGKKMIEEQFDLKIMTKRYIDVYNKLYNL